MAFSLTRLFELRSALALIWALLLDRFCRFARELFGDFFWLAAMLRGICGAVIRAERAAVHVDVMKERHGEAQLRAPHHREKRTWTTRCRKCEIRKAHPFERK